MVSTVPFSVSFPPFSSSIPMLHQQNWYLQVDPKNLNSGLKFCHFQLHFLDKYDILVHLKLLKSCSLTSCAKSAAH